MFVQVLTLSNMDKYWTNFQEDTENQEQIYSKRPKLDMDKILRKKWTSSSVTSPQHIIDKTWTKFWTNFCPIFVQYEKIRTWEKTVDKTWTIIKIFGQNIDKNLTKLSKILIFLTNIGH